MPRPTVATIVSVIIGARRSPRKQIRKSCVRSSSISFRRIVLSFSSSCCRQYSRVASRSPNRRSDSRRALSSDHPRAFRSSRRICRWTSSSSSTSDLTASGRRLKYPKGRRPESCLRTILSPVKHRFDSARVTPPVVGFLTKPFASCSRECVVAGAPIVLRWPPLSVDETLSIEPVQRLVERGVFDRELAGRELVHFGRDPVPVHGAVHERPEYEQVKGALDERQGSRLHATFPLDDVGRRIVRQANT